MGEVPPEPIVHCGTSAGRPLVEITLSPEMPLPLVTNTHDEPSGAVHAAG